MDMYIYIYCSIYHSNNLDIEFQAPSSDAEAWELRQLLGLKLRQLLGTISIGGSNKEHEQLIRGTMENECVFPNAHGPIPFWDATMWQFGQTE